MYDAWLAREFGRLRGCDFVRLVPAANQRRNTAVICQKFWKYGIHIFMAKIVCNSLILCFFCSVAGRAQQISTNRPTETLANSVIIWVKPSERIDIHVPASDINEETCTQNSVPLISRYPAYGSIIISSKKEDFRSCKNVQFLSYQYISPLRFPRSEQEIDEFEITFRAEASKVLGDPDEVGVRNFAIGNTIRFCRGVVSNDRRSCSTGRPIISRPNTSSPPSNANTRIICYGSPIPVGYVITNRATPGVICPLTIGDTRLYNSWVVTNYLDLPKGSVLPICLGQDLPPGWSLVSTQDQMPLGAWCPREPTETETGRTYVLIRKDR